MNKVSFILLVLFVFPILAQETKITCLVVPKVVGETLKRADIKQLDVEALCKNVDPGVFSFNELLPEGVFGANEFQRLREWSKRQKNSVVEQNISVAITILSGKKAGDVSCLESDPENNGAAFMVASNANALCSVYGVLISPEKLYTDICTQEANAVLPTLAAYKDRYEKFGLPSVHKGWVSDSDKQKSLMVFSSALKQADVFRYKNGYIAFKKDALSDIQKNFENESIVQMVAYHKDASVILNKKLVQGCGRWFYAPKESKQKIDHIIAAAVNIGENVSNLPGGYLCGELLNATNPSAAEAIAKKALKTSYEHAILLAAYHKKQKLFLTLLGAGVFGNRVKWVKEAIIQAIKEHRHLLGAMKIYVIDYSGGLTWSQD